MTRRLSNLFALMAAAMLPLQLALCVCGSDGHSHGDAAHAEHHDAATVEHHEHSHDTDHSHDGGHADSAPAPGHDGQDEHGPCQCGPQNMPTTLPKTETADSSHRQFVCWVCQPITFADSLVSSHSNLVAGPRPFWSVMNVFASSQGNPCALLCRWLI